MLISINEKKQAFCRFTFLLSQKAHSKTLVFSYFLNTQSPLAWGRGLKLLNTLLTIFPIMVAPRVGAWIETLRLPRVPVVLLVAPRVGAWIETLLNTLEALKSSVAPRVGAWIETWLDNSKLVICNWSPLAWGRGLKQFYCKKYG